MSLHNLSEITTKKKKRVGRGPGSGKGKTAGRGMKGQKKRGKVRIGFEGGQLPLSKRLPFVRGKGFKGPQRKPFVLDLEKLNIFRSGSILTIEGLQEEGLVPKKVPSGVKILANGEINKKLTLEGIKVSKGAKEKIEAAGGKVL
ncbi:MAG: 50S ribosomal protein L15 [Candidatus Cloacimonetes bacterium]|nr:50S ribosomal protein L15 [Candidatus Cloacimonadota bacterium]